MRSCPIRFCAFPIWGLMVLNSTAVAGGRNCGFDEKQEITVGGVVNYGRTTALSADHAVVGSPVGRIQIYRRDDQGTPSNPGDDRWVRQTHLTSSDSSLNGGGFGGAISVHGHWLIAGARQVDVACPNDENCNAGAAYLYRLDDMGTASDPVDDAWVLHATLTAPDAAAFDEFGGSVALTDDWAMVGATGDDDGCPPDTTCSSGSVYLFRREDRATPNDDGDDLWSFDSKLNASDATSGHHFGTSLDTDGTRLIVGAYNRGAYVFRKTEDGNQWVEEAKLVPSSPSSGFAGEVSIDGGFAVISAYFTDVDDISDAGAAFVFGHDAGLDPSDPTDDTWIEQVRLTAENPAIDDMFGYDVSVSGDRIVIGAYLRDDHCGASLCNSGAAYVYAHNDGGSPLDPGDDMWALDDSLYARYMGFGDSFGSAVSIHQNVILVGAMERGMYALLFGSAYLFTTDVDCNGNGVQDGCDLLDNTSADCDENRTPDECDVAAGRARDCDSNGTLDRCEISDGIHTDCNFNGIPDACDLADPDTHDCNSNGQVDYCEFYPGGPGDCNFNHVPDECDLALGLEADCDLNGQLDSCEIYDDASLDCNDDDILDRCTSAEMDCNSNSIPDECEHSTPLQTIPLGVESPYDQIGSYVDIDDARVVIGSIPYYSRPDRDERVLVYRRNDDGTPNSPGDDLWDFEVALADSDAVNGDQFGFSVAIDDRRIVTGAPGSTIDGVFYASSVYVFWNSDNGTPLNELDDLWLQETKLTAPEVVRYSRFGFAVDVDGAHLVVTAPYSGMGGTAYVYRHSSAGTPEPEDDVWVPESKLIGQSAGEFGYAVALRGNRLAVAAPGEVDEDSNRGAVYVFQRGGNNRSGDLDNGPWIQQQRLTAPNSESLARFGSSVAINGERIIVGELRQYSIAAHVFRWDDGETADGANGPWVWEAELVVNDGGRPARGGPSVSASADRVLLGGIQSYPYYGGGLTRAFRLHDNGTPLEDSDDYWFSEGPMEGSIDWQDEEMFGLSAAVAGSFAAIQGGVNSGPMSVFLIALTVDDCNRNGTPDDCDITNGTSVDSNLNGLPDECERVAVFLACMAGPVDDPGSLWYRNPDECRRAFDNNADGQVDLRDWALQTSRTHP